VGNLQRNDRYLEEDDEEIMYRVDQYDQQVFADSPEKTESPETHAEEFYSAKLQDEPELFEDEDEDRQQVMR
jgi:hypothetical protein